MEMKMLRGGLVATKTVELASLLLIAFSAITAQGLPERPWENVLEDVLRRSESERPNAQNGTATPDRSEGAKQDVRVAEAPHRLVGEFVRYFSGAGATQFRSSLKRLDAYRPTFEKIFDREGLPRTLLLVGLVESGYIPTARSPKNAMGIWQLIPETAMRFGLEVNSKDERTDPVKSTEAAARYLKFLYARFGDWPLALAAYNAGERRIQDAIQRSQAHDFWRLVESGALPRETQGYVPAVLAAQYLVEGRYLQSGTTHELTPPTTRRVVFAPFGISTNSP